MCASFARLKNALERNSAPLACGRGILEGVVSADPIHDSLNPQKLWALCIFYCMHKCITVIWLLERIEPFSCFNLMFVMGIWHFLFIQTAVFFH